MALLTLGKPGDNRSGKCSILDEPENTGLLRLTKLVEHVFHVPVAYMELWGHLKVVTHIGSGSEYRKSVTTCLTAPEFIAGDIKFAAAAPIRSINGMDLGLLVIADVQPRPDFSPTDQETLAELAGVLAGKMELRRMASQVRASEWSIEEAEHRFQSIANAAPVMIIYSSADGGSSFVNKAWLEFTGRSLAEELGDGFSDTYHPDYREGVLKSYWDAFQERRPLVVEFPMRRHDGEYRWMKVRGRPRLLENGVDAGYVGCFVDTTDQRAAMVDLNKQILCTAGVAEAAGVFYLILDPQGRIEYMSLLCQRTSGRHPGQMCGRPLWEACDAAIPGKAAISDAIRRVVASRSTMHTEVSYSLPAGAGAVKLRWSFTPIVSERNELISVAAVALELSGGRRSSLACAHLRCACSRPAPNGTVA